MFLKSLACLKMLYVSTMECFFRHPMERLHKYTGANVFYKNSSLEVCGIRRLMPFEPERAIEGKTHLYFVHLGLTYHVNSMTFVTHGPIHNEFARVNRRVRFNLPDEDWTSILSWKLLRLVASTLFSGCFHDGWNVFSLYLFIFFSG